MVEGIGTSGIASAADDTGLIATPGALEMRLRWLSSWMIHNANHLRESRDGLKVGGHRSSCAATHVPLIGFAAVPT